MSENAVKSKESNRTTSKKVWLVPVIIVCALAIFCFATWLFTPFFMVNPTFNEDAYNELQNVPEAHWLTLDNGGVGGAEEISGWILQLRFFVAGNEQAMEDRPLLLYFGGINEDASTAILKFYKLWQNGCLVNCDIACLDWPGYGKNKGLPTDESLRQCAAGLLYQLKNGDEFHYDKIYVLGYSMGTGPATYAASVCGCDGLILLAPYESSTDLYNSVTPVFYGPLKGLLRYRMETGEYASKCSMPVTIIACKDDKRVPFESSKKLAEDFAGRSPAFYEFSGISHGDLPSASEVINLIEEATR